MQRPVVDVDLEVDPHAFARSVANMRALVAVLPRLEAAPCSVPDLVALAPELVCELGFERGLVSRVADGVWYPELMYIVGDPAWAAEIGSAGKAEPLRLAPGLHETTLVQTRQAILVTNAQDQSERRWGHPGMVAASRTNSYVAAPIMSGDQVVGILTGDRYGSGRDVDELDRDLLAAFAEAFRLALTRAALAERFRSTGLVLRQVSGDVEESDAAVHQTPTVRIDRHPDEAPDGIVVRSRPRAARPLPKTLTGREIEVLTLMAAGKTNLAIATELFISDGTVKQHVKHILRKLEVANRSEAIVRWFHAGGGAHAE